VSRLRLYMVGEWCFECELIYFLHDVGPFRDVQHTVNVRILEVLEKARPPPPHLCMHRTPPAQCHSPQFPNT
jgi:hypothetical protein